MKVGPTTFTIDPDSLFQSGKVLKHFLASSTSFRPFQQIRTTFREIGFVFYLGPFPNELKRWRLVVKDGRLRRREIRILPKFAAFDALAPDALVFRHGRRNTNSCHIKQPNKCKPINMDILSGKRYFAIEKMEPVFYFLSFFLIGQITISTVCIWMRSFDGCVARLFLC